MDKLSKIFLGIILALTVALIVMTCMYFNLRKIAIEYRDAYADMAQAVLQYNMSRQ